MAKLKWKQKSKSHGFFRKILIFLILISEFKLYRLVKLGGANSEMVVFGFMLTSQYKKISYLGILYSLGLNFVSKWSVLYELKIGC